MNRLKVCVLGDGEVGKSAWITRHSTGQFVENYKPTMGAAVHNLRFQGEKGTVLFEVWDCAGRDEYGGLREGYLLHSNAAVVMFDLTQKTTFKSLDKWIALARKVVPDIPVIVCGNKCDNKDIRVFQPEISGWFSRQKGVTFYYTSAKTNFNLEKPFLKVSGQTQFR